MIFTSNTSLHFLKDFLENPDLKLTCTKERLLCKQAQYITEKYYQKKVFIRGLIEFSNFCSCNCCYCGLQKDNNKIERYRLQVKEILQSVQNIYDTGIRSVVLQSGEDFFFTREKLSSLVASIHTSFPDMAITLSIGERSEKTYKTLLNAGAERYLIKHESCNPVIYSSLHPGQTLLERLQSQTTIKNTGYILGSGFLVGLPNQTTNDIINELHFLSQRKYDMWGIGVFIPSSNTPLRNHPHGNVFKTLKAMILSRIFNNTTMIPITTAFHSIAGEELSVRALQFCANVFMINFTPTSKQLLYKIYDGKQNMSLDKVVSLIYKADKVPSFCKGDPFYGDH